MLEKLVENNKKTSKKFYKNVDILKIFSTIFFFNFCPKFVKCSKKFQTIFGYFCKKIFKILKNFKINSK